MTTVAAARIIDTLALVEDSLAEFLFVAQDERDLQRQVTSVLRERAKLTCDLEVVAGRDRWDVLVTRQHVDGTPTRVVLELKVAGSAAALERQAQRYAGASNVDAVALVTTSQRLARDVVHAGAAEIGGKPFRVIALRST